MIQRSTYQVGCHDGIESLWLQHHPGRHRIHQHLIDCNIRELGADFSSNLVPHDHAISLSIALSDHGQQLSWSSLSNFKSESEQSRNSMSSENGHFGSSLPRLASMRSAAMSCIFALAVLANDDPIKITCLALTKGRLCASQHPRWPHISILLKWLTDRKSQSPEGDMIGDIFKTQLYFRVEKYI